jgi:hypothetical protein
MSRSACIELAELTGVDPDELVEWWEERAAIREYDGGQPRPEAEQDALEDMRAMLELGPWIVGERRGPKSAAMIAEYAAGKRASE